MTRTRIIIFCILLLLALITLGAKCDTRSADEKQYGWKPAGWGETLEITGNVGDTMLLRCYDQGGQVSASFLLVFGSLKGGNYGQNCSAALTLTILDSSAYYGHKTWPIADPFSGLPATGEVLVKVSEAAMLLQPRACIYGQLVAVPHTYQELPYMRTVGWERLEIWTMIPCERAMRWH